MGINHLDWCEVCHWGGLGLTTVIMKCSAASDTNLALYIEKVCHHWTKLTSDKSVSLLTMYREWQMLFEKEEGKFLEVKV